MAEKEPSPPALFRQGELITEIARELASVRPIGATSEYRVRALRSYMQDELVFTTEDGSAVRTSCVTTQRCATSLWWRDPPP